MTYKMYSHKPINVGFIILCPNCNIGQLTTTISSIKHSYPNSPYHCVLPEHCHPDDLKSHVKGGKTITSLINAGMSPPPCDEWNFIIMAGNWVKKLLDKKYAYFMESEKDIFFPIVEKKMNFVDGTMNGILIHRKAFQDIGFFANNSPMEVCKLMWAIDAIDKGYQFKAILL